ncbi:hypothetical protein WOLCODRAFT_153178 [Wolfiporia cocos MD-104 SS10]|uniref:Uncharacterized protein n=1 Tax=Wolfiporia cocos (strain MD-104) TaxID=742152 RepID=A0A2H3K3W9_WOLCO|nr:hypothetical protein WOLCODRAFT_153178 [Wolfiporia cocos MD-104 SS10]
MPGTFTQASEQSSKIRCIAGSKPGVLDPSQRDRLLGGRGSTLSFAYQHASTASESLVAPLPPEALAQSRVFVIETIGQEQTLCREVPGAILGPGIESEEPSRWPRTVYICGYACHCLVGCAV